jgi:hypothetical protein
MKKLIIFFTLIIVYNYTKAQILDRSFITETGGSKIPGKAIIRVRFSIADLSQVDSIFINCESSKDKEDIFKAKGKIERTNEGSYKFLTEDKNLSFNRIENRKSFLLEYTFDADVVNVINSNSIQLKFLSGETSNTEYTLTSHKTTDIKKKRLNESSLKVYYSGDKIWGNILVSKNCRYILNLYTVGGVFIKTITSRIMDSNDEEIQELDTSGLIKGLYLLELKTDDESSFLKITAP